MKKLLLAGTAFAALAMSAMPAHAEGLKLGLGGFFRGYAVFTDHDDDFGVAGASTNLRDFDFRRDSEIHFTGEATTDNGLTVGVHAEQDLGGAVQTDEAYMYFSGGWGRVNFGSEDGAAYLLQVAAPSADSNVDGLRTYIQTFNLGVDVNGDADITDPGESLVLDYAHADYQEADRFTYLTPKFSGFQAGFSYAPEEGQNGVGNNVAGMATDDDNDEFEDLWEVGARWDGEFQGFGLSAGAGYSDSSVEAAGGVFTDAPQTWNAGLGVTFGAFSLGGAYLASDYDVTNVEVDEDIWTIGAAWDNGPYHLGVSYYNAEVDTDVLLAGSEVSVDRVTVGGGYTFGEGMTFRGSVAWAEPDTTDFVGGSDEDAFQVAVGTDIQF